MSVVVCVGCNIDGSALMGALNMGADAINAVLTASKFCITCGGGVDSFTVR